MAIVACQASTSSPAVSLASDRATSWMSSAVSCLSAASNSVRCMTDILGTTGARVGGFPGSIRAITCEQGVSRPVHGRFCCAVPPSGHGSASSRLAAHQTVEDVGLADQHLLESEHPEDAHEHRGAAHD